MSVPAAKLSDPTPALRTQRDGAPAHSGKHDGALTGQEDGGGEDAAPFDPVAYERANVHRVYNAIAPHFSATRYKPWPLVEQFLSTLPVGSVGADLGCGNGKYLPSFSIIAPAPSKDEGRSARRPPQTAAVLTIGSDHSDQLIELAYRNAGSLPSGESLGPIQNEVLVADALRSHHRSQAFDYAISIAAIHHFSTRERRMQAVQEMIRLVRPRPAHAFQSASASMQQPACDGQADMGAGPGRIMLYAWAMEQRGEGRRAGKFDSEADAPQDKPQDVLVPWVVHPTLRQKKGKAKQQTQVAEAQPEAEGNGEAAEREPVYQRCESDLGVAENTWARC